MMNSNHSDGNLLLSDLLFLWDDNNVNNIGMDSNSNDVVNDASLLSSSTATDTMENLQLLDDSLSSLFQCLPSNSFNFPNQQQGQFPAFTNDNININNNDFFDFFHNESQQQLKITDGGGSEPSSSQVLLHHNHPFIVQPFTNTDEPHIVMHPSHLHHQQLQQQDQDSGIKKRKKSSSLSVMENELQLHEKKKVKRKRKKRSNPADKDDAAAGDVDPDAPPKPKRITGLNKPLILSDALQTIMEGAIELSRPEIVKRLWNYIKSNDLQDPADRRFILCDEKLKAIFHQDRVNSFGMNRDLSAHLTKKEVNLEPLLIDIYSINKSEEPPSSIITTANSNNPLLTMDDFSPVPTADTPDVMTPSDSEIFLQQKWSITNSSF